MELKEEPSELEEVIQEEQERLKTETDPRWRASLEDSIPRMRHQMMSLPTLELRFPNQAFEGTLVFHGVQRRAEPLKLALPVGDQ